MEEKRLYGLRGAICCENDPADIERRVSELYDELVCRNNIIEDDIVSLFFSITKDLTAFNPAAALRKSGRGQNLALFSVAEPDVEGSLPRVIRVLIHCYSPYGTIPQHSYRNGAEALRPDRVAVMRKENDRA